MNNSNNTFDIHHSFLNFRRKAKIHLICYKFLTSISSNLHHKNYCLLINQKTFLNSKTTEFFKSDNIFIIYLNIIKFFLSFIIIDFYPQFFHLSKRILKSFKIFLTSPRTICSLKHFPTPKTFSQTSQKNSKFQSSFII